MGELTIGTSEVVSNVTFTIEMSYTSGNGRKDFTIQDTDKIYFDNNVCKKAGVYSITAYMSGTSGTGSPSFVRAGVSPAITVGMGWANLVYPASSCTMIKKLSVGSTVGAWVDGEGATFSKAYCVVTKIV